MGLHLEGLTLAVLEGLCLVGSSLDGRRELVAALRYRGRRVQAAYGAPAYVLCAVEVEPESRGISKPLSTCRPYRAEARCKKTASEDR